MKLNILGELMTMVKTIRYLIGVLGVTVGILAFQEREVQASSIPADAISIDYDAQRLLIKESTDTDIQIFFNIPKIKTVKKKIANGVTIKQNVLTASTWECYDYDQTNGVAVDLSTLNRIKDNYIQIKGDPADDPVTIKIPAISSKVSASYNVLTDQVVMNDITDKKNPIPIQNRTLEYRVANSGWKTYTKDNFTYYQVRGVSMYFRLKANPTATLQTSSLTTLTDIVDADDQEIQAYIVGSFPGKEVKVRIAKQTSAPKVTVDYAKHQFRLPKNTEYRVIAGGKINNWITSDTTGTKLLNLSEISAQIGQNISASLEVRTKSNGTKTASKANRIDFDMPAAAPEVHNVHTADGIDIVDCDIYDSWIGDTQSTSIISTGYRYKQKTKAFQGVCIFSDTPEEYEVYISKNGQLPTAASAVTVIKPKKVSSTSDNDVETLLSASKVKNGDRIYIRKKANAKNKVFSSYFAGLGTVSYDPKQMP